jgi:HK97 family phage prohead protease
MKRRECRVIDCGLELRADGQKPMIRGYAAVFDKPSEPMGWDGGFTEIVKPGAFTKSLQESDVRALWNHNPEQILGRTTSGTLRLSEDATGLAVEIDPPDWASAYVESIRRGDVTQMSFGFRAVKDRFSTTSDGNTVRELVEVRLYDVSPVAFPAYPDTSVEARAGYTFGLYHHSTLIPPHARAISSAERAEHEERAQGGAESQQDDAPTTVETPRILIRLRELELIERI